MLAGRIARGGNKIGVAKAGYRRVNDKCQWWEAGASDKKGGEQNGKGRVPKKIPKRQANAESH